MPVKRIGQERRQDKAAVILSKIKKYKKDCHTQEELALQCLPFNSSVFTNWHIPEKGVFNVTVE